MCIRDSHHLDPPRVLHKHVHLVGRLDDAQPVLDALQPGDGQRQLHEQLEPPVVHEPPELGGGRQRDPLLHEGQPIQQVVAFGQLGQPLNLVVDNLVELSGPFDDAHKLLGAALDKETLDAGKHVDQVRGGVNPQRRLVFIALLQPGPVDLELSVLCLLYTSRCV